MKILDTPTAQSYRVSFSQAPCDNFDSGPHHPGHMKCVRLAKQVEAVARQRAYQINQAGGYTAIQVKALQELRSKLTTEYPEKRKKRERRTRHKKSGKELE